MVKSSSHSILIFLIALVYQGCNKFTLDTAAPDPVDVIENKETLLFKQFSSSGSAFSCGITSDDRLYCWGNAPGIIVDHPTEYVHPSGYTPKIIDHGRGHTCIIFTGPADDEIYCIGTGTDGQLGNNSTTSVYVLTKVQGLPSARFIDLGLGATHSCAVSEAKEVYCWGTGRIGNNTTGTTLLPAKLTITDVIEVDSNWSHTCAMKSDQSMWCWGIGTNGVLGQNSGTAYAVPVRVKHSSGVGFLAGVTDISVGQAHTCAIANDDVYCWGLHRLSGVDAATNSLLPLLVNGLNGTTDLESGDHHNCAINSTTGSLHCWGRNANSQIGGTPTSFEVTPKLIDLGGLKATSMTLGSGANPTRARTCILTDQSQVWCWGMAHHGVFGTVKNQIATEFKLQPQTAVTQIHMKENNACYTVGDLPYSSGYNDYAQHTAIAYVTTPVVIDSKTTIATYCGRFKSCFLTDANKLFCRGLAFTSIEELTALGSNIRHVAMSSHSVCALNADDELYCFGASEIGNGSTLAAANATPYKTLTNVKTAEGGANLFCALKNDRTVWCWGKNTNGAVGHNNAADTTLNSPTQVQGLPDLSTATTLQLDVERSIGCLRADNRIFCWGTYAGKLANTGSDHSPLAVEVTGLGTNIKSIALFGPYGICAAKNDNTITCMVYSDYNLLTGLFPSQQITTKKFKSMGTITQIDGNGYMLCALMANGRQYCIGNNSMGGMTHSGIQPPLIDHPVNWVEDI